jgi:hypothetical protein
MCLPLPIVRTILRKLLARASFLPRSGVKNGAAACWNDWCTPPQGGGCWERKTHGEARAQREKDDRGVL